MANELQYQTQVAFTKNGSTRQRTAVSINLTVAGNGISEGVKSIGFAAEEAVPLGGVTTPGFAIFKNLNATNSITIGYKPAAFVPFTVIPPGQEVKVFLSAAPYAQSAVAACLLDWLILDA